MGSGSSIRRAGLQERASGEKPRRWSTGSADLRPPSIAVPPRGGRFSFRAWTAGKGHGHGEDLVTVVPNGSEAPPRRSLGKVDSDDPSTPDLSPSRSSSKRPSGLHPMQIPRQRIEMADLQTSMREARKEVSQWNPKDYVFGKVLAKSLANHGQVDLMQKTSGGGSYAVKRMPNSWVQSGPGEFALKHPKEKERPWCDVGMLRILEDVQYPFLCKLQGIFRDGKQTYVCTELAEGGELLAWMRTCSSPASPDREHQIVHVASDICLAIRSLHDLGIVHRDISPENIVLTKNEEVKIIDFGMATIGRICLDDGCGKDAYQAPESSSSKMYDGFLADVFATGVTLFAMAVGDLPWQKTGADGCPMFAIASEHGIRSFMQQSTLRGGQTTLTEVLSKELLDTIAGLMDFDPKQRLCLGEACYADGTAGHRVSAWEKLWLSYELT
mmetsp:Transcript_12057/g.21405  ORF Transcript_12057/g.21405 Transcript_12057/m.21405 type:complete len:441 (+) Transcript_12057:85-1407(+)